ncbi:MAG TPA: cyclase family protein [Syntrophales bacterium]|nr:cyclase family protein [Syntrophales bacterium]
MAGKAEWMDVSLTLKADMMHWPGDPPVFIERVRDMNAGDTVNLTKISMGAHSGTHVDAPLHFIESGKGVDRISFDALIGPARVVGISANNAMRKGDLARHRIKKGERILLRTRNSTKKIFYRDAFTEEFVYLDKTAAEFLVERGIRTIGVDYLSVGGYKKDGHEVHKALLGAGILIIEGLDLSQVLPGRYDMICLPAKIGGSDGAPARVIVKARKVFRNKK